MNKLSDLQENLIKMISWFDSFCRENDLKYYAVAGTMLGAVRHKGFIPWDDDIDVGMPRNDYEKLKRIMGEKIFEHYVLETPQSSRYDYSYSYSKIYDINTTLIERKKTPVTRGTFIDIFPLDGYGKDKKQARKIYLSKRMKYNLYISRVSAVRKERDVKKNVAIVLSGLIPGINNRKMRDNLDFASKTLSFANSNWIGYYCGHWGFKEIMPKEWFGNPKEYEFEGVSIFGVENSEEYLSYLYGDWRKLPPEEKQITHHDFIKLDLDKSYLELDEYKKINLI